MNIKKCPNCRTESKKYLRVGSDFIACSKCGYLWKKDLIKVE